MEDTVNGNHNPVPEVLGVCLNVWVCFGFLSAEVIKTKFKKDSFVKVFSFCKFVWSGWDAWSLLILVLLRNCLIVFILT